MLVLDCEVEGLIPREDLVLELNQKAPLFVIF